VVDQKIIWDIKRLNSGRRLHWGISGVVGRDWPGNRNPSRLDHPEGSGDRVFGVRCRK